MRRFLVALTLSLSLLACQPTPVAAGPIHHWSEAPAEVRAEHSPEAIQAFIDGWWRNLWIETYWRRILEFTRGVERARAEYPSGQCGGDLPPCRVMQRESGGDIRIWNGGCYAPVGWTGLSPCGSSSASGKWQFVRGTWAGFGGYLNAADAPEAVQDAKARQAWAGGRGCSHWMAC